MSFEYRPGSGIVRSLLILNEGSNTLVVSARNEAGSARDNVNIVFNKPLRVNPPAIRFLNPPNPVTVDRNVFPIKVQTTNVGAWGDVKVSVNGIGTTNFSLSREGVVTTNIGLKEGLNRIEVSGKNESGVVTKSATITYKKAVKAITPVITEPCIPPVLRMIVPSQPAITTDNQNLTFRAEVGNISNRNQLVLTLNGRRITNFILSGNELQFSASLNEGSNALVLEAKNDCGSKSLNASITFIPPVIEEPCLPPKVSFSIKVITSGDVNHELKGSVTNVTSRREIAVSINGTNYTDYQYTAGTGELSARFVLNPGTSTIVITAKNSCGQDSGSEQVVVKELVEEEKPCGVRINPGNSAWQFCLVTSRGTFNRKNLTNPAFNYSGQASSLYFSPIAGGGDAIVKGKPFSLRPGQYYLFTGNLTVTVSTKNQGSMGKWSVCIISDKAPVSGNGNNRPKSPCEEVDAGKSQGTRKVKQ